MLYWTKMVKILRFYTGGNHDFIQKERKFYKAGIRRICYERKQRYKERMSPEMKLGELK